MHANLCIWTEYLAGQVIKAWDIGVATMRIGEICQLICKPEYAYGSAGSPPKIPPSATLVFQVPSRSVLILQVAEMFELSLNFRVRGVGRVV